LVSVAAIQTGLKQNRIIGGKTMRTQEQFMQDMAKMKPNIYLYGEKVGRDDPRVVKSSATIRMTFSLVNDPEFEPLLTAYSPIIKEKINRFTHISQSVEDLLKKQELTRKICGLAGGCIQRCMGVDMLNGISVVTKDCDLKHGTNYHENFLKYAKHFQKNDLVGAGSQTDPKGDRILRPSQQADPDQYLHVVERREDGIIVRGCKLHNTMAAYADELLVTPTRAMGKEEGDWALSFAIPADAEGVYIIAKEDVFEDRESNLQAPITNIAHLECMTVFDDVFVPNDRIFLNGETDFAGKMALSFALFHRHSYTGCKPGLGDIIVGLTALLAEYNNIKKQSHVRGKLVDIVSVSELIFAAGLSSAYKSSKSASGTQVPNIIYANIGRRHAGHNIFHELNILCDIAGGLAGTLPHSKDYNNPEIGDWIRKYIKRKEGVSGEDIYRAYNLAADLLTSQYNTTSMLIAGTHGGGSPIMEDIAIYGQYDFNSKMELAKRLAGITD